MRIEAAHLIVEGVPYVTPSKQVAFGTLVSELSLAGDVSTTPGTHVIYFIGETPCDSNGAALGKIINSSGRQDLGKGLLIDHTFSSKPGPQGYADYYEKVSTYVAILSHHAQVLQPAVTAQTFAPVAPDAEDPSPFNYLETASARAGISAVTEKLRVRRIAIVGLGGTGSYVLDLVAKCPVDEIHLFDADYFLTHNAFRAPGAPTLEELRERPKKVVWHAESYAPMHKRIVPHDVFVRADTVDQLREMDFVFICIDSNEDKAVIIARLEAWGIAFIDVGMGVQLEAATLFGIVRVTTSTPAMREHVRGNRRIPLARSGVEDEYSKNIQVADLNALNATLAVIRWKKLQTFYADLEHEHNMLYTIDGNDIVNEDCQ